MMTKTMMGVGRRMKSGGGKRGVVTALPLILIGVGVVILLAALVSGLGGSSDPQGRFFVVTCDFKLDKGVFGGVAIEDEQCRVTDRRDKCPVFLLFQTEEGNVKLLDSVKVIDSESFKIGTFTGSKQVTLKGCTEDDVVTIRAEGVDGVLEDEVVVRFR